MDILCREAAVLITVIAVCTQQCDDIVVIILSHMQCDIEFIADLIPQRIVCQSLFDMITAHTGCVELLLRDGRMISIDCTGVEDALDVTMAQRSELDYLIYNDPLGYADLILNGDPEKYLRNVAESHGLED